MQYLLALFKSILFGSLSLKLIGFWATVFKKKNVMKIKMRLTRKQKICKRFYKIKIIKIL